MEKAKGIKPCKPLTPEQIFDEYKHFVGTYDIDSNTVTEERLMAWAEDPKRELICIFCGSEIVNRGGFIYCQRCNEYKGIMPNCPNL